MSANNVDGSITTFYFEEIIDNPTSVPPTVENEEDTAAGDKLVRRRIDINSAEPRSTFSSNNQGEERQEQMTDTEEEDDDKHRLKI